MRPLYQSLLTLLCVAVAVAAFFTLRTKIAQGAFETVTPTGYCRAIARGLANPQDLEIDAPHKLLFVAARDGLYSLKLDDLAAAPVRLAGTSADFHPVGLSLYRTSTGIETLMAIDRRAKGLASVEIYGVNFTGPAPKLEQQTVTQARLLTSPRDIAAISPIGYYVTNDHGSTGALGRFAEDYLLWPHSFLALSNGGGLHVAVQRIGFANGVLVSPDGRFVYVTAGSDRQVIAFSRQDFTGNLTEIGSLSLPAQPDNMSMDGQGNLIIAGRTKPGSSQVFRVHRDGKGVPQSYDTLFSDDGHQLARASSGAIWNGHLFIGSSSDDHMLDCAVK